MSRILPLVKSVSLSAQVFETLRAAIFAEVYRPGEPLVELQLSRELQVSQATVRQALVQLEHIGLVTRVPNKGTTVTELSDRDIRERMSIRMSLEEMAWLSAAVRMEESEFQTVRDRLQTLLEAVRANDYFGAAQADLEFHRYIWRCSGNQTLVELLVQLTTPLFAFVSIQRARNRNNLEETTRSHEDVITALRSRDSGLMRTVLRQHLDMTGVMT